ncbi:Fatty acid synthase [Cyphomyrmex costatus]|uniref:Fatty acid synthase n=1 Tax=Cyphomyrmex costatus TaxID=456900 RepID=A0A151IB63_9HYME|nr:Fatty acid synthase [Cyphomyrmex costatus]
MDSKEILNDIVSNEEIVISGIAGRFPNSDNMNQLRENLFNKIDLVIDHNRWEKEHMKFSEKLSFRMGTVNNIQKFDADFFGLSFEQAHALIPETRMLLEHSYEAVIDAGINPKQLRGKNTAVIVGMSTIDTQKKLLCENDQLGGLNIVGCSKSTVANMISYCLDLKGPSQAVDTACSSGLYAIALGYHYIISGKCEDAIIGTANLCFNPFISLQLTYLGVLSPEGCCRPFDSAGNGYSRSETIAVIYLQKAKNAKRIYAICPHIKLNNDGYKNEDITCPSMHTLITLLTEFYNECGIPISCLDYLEAHGTGTKVGDFQEINAIHNVLCKNREVPLMIGSVKSNLGHAEPASAFSQIAKVKHLLPVQNIYVKEIYCNVPYHSSYLASMETELLFNLNRIIPRPKKRSSKWISTSVPRNEWLTSGKLSSADYHTRSILNIVLFEQTLHLIPNNGITIELAPCGVLQHILKESLHPEVTNIVLTQRTEQNKDVIFQGIGRLYNCGLQPQVANLYPPVEYPVSRGTAMISPFIRWNHFEDWFIPCYETQKSIKSRERYVEILLEDHDYEYMSDCIIDERNLLPTAGYLALVWETIGMMKGQKHTIIPIVFQDVNFIRAIHLSKQNAVKLKIAIQKDGKFEITEEDRVVVTGTVYETSNPELEMTSIDLLWENSEKEFMTVRDIYTELKLRGYQYSGWFRGLKSASISGKKGHIIWRKNWVTFIDSMLQMNILEHDTRDLYVPTSIQKLVINPMLHDRKLQDANHDVEGVTTMEKQLQVQVYKEIDVIIAGGVEIQGLKFTQITRRKLAQNAVIEEYTFVAHCDRAKVSLNEAIWMSAQLALEDHQIVKVTAVELVEDNDDVSLECLSSTLLVKTFQDTPLIQTNITLLTSPNRFNSANLSQNISIENLKKSFKNELDNALIVAGFNLLTKEHTSLKRLLSFLREGGYLLTREKCEVIDYKKYLQQYELNVILEKRTDKEMIVLLKKKVYVKERIIVYINNDNFDWLENLKPLVRDENKLDKNSRIIIVGERDFECGLLGFINCIRKEPGGEFVRGVLVQDEEASKFSLKDPFYVQQLDKDMTINVLRANKTWGSYRYLKLLEPEARLVPTAHVCQMVRGDLSTFCWIENNRSVVSRREDLVHVVYSSLNFRDVMFATGKLTPHEAILKGRLFQYLSLGMEYAGWDANGQRVMGICDTDCIANVVVKDKDLCWKVPETWTFEEAATIPCVYSTAYMALYIYGKMKKGNKILIHSGTGGVGQAAIHLALHEGCEVFTTVGTNDKRNFIKKMFPVISDGRIGSSRDTSFEQMIMQQTKGRGVDIVLNSLAEEKLIASIRCLAQNGHFLEIGKFDLVSNNPLSISAFQKGISFHGVILENIFTDNYMYKSLLSKMIADGLKNGTIKSLQVKVFPKTNIEEAFRYMAGGKHIGKIIINIHEKNEPLDRHILAYRRYYCHRDRSYVILGGLGGFGLELTDWLIFRGARNIVLISRNGIKNGYQRIKIRLWKSYGINVLIIKNIDVADFKDCEYLLRIAEKEAPVDAIFNLGAVLKDNILKNQTAETFAVPFQSKVRATQMLDKLSRKICLKLRHFVMFSSISCGRGITGQTNYGMANSVMERICEKRVEEELPGLAIQWGAIDDVGILENMQEISKKIIIGGTSRQKISCCLDKLDMFLLQSRPIMSSMVVAEKRVERHGFGRNSLVATVANILGISKINTVSPNSSLAELGMGSLMIVEMKHTLEREFDLFLTLQEISNLTFAKLTKMFVTSISE